MQTTRRCWRNEPVKVIFAYPPESEFDRLMREYIIEFLLSQTDKDVLAIMSGVNDKGDKVE